MMHAIIMNCVQNWLLVPRCDAQTLYPSCYNNCACALVFFMEAMKLVQGFHMFLHNF